MDGAFDLAISSAVLAGAQESDFADLIQRNMLNFALGRAMAAAQHEVGDLGEYGLGEAHPIRVGLHAVIGCAYAEAAGGDCAGGAAAGATSALYAALLDASGGIEDHARYDGLHTTLAGLVGGITAEIVSGEAEIGNTVSASAFRFNYLEPEHHRKWRKAVDDLLTCKPDESPDQCRSLQATARAYGPESHAKSKALAAICANNGDGNKKACLDGLLDVRQFLRTDGVYGNNNALQTYRMDLLVGGEVDGEAVAANLDTALVKVFLENPHLIGAGPAAWQALTEELIRQDAAANLGMVLLGGAAGGIVAIGGLTAAGIAGGLTEICVAASFSCGMLVADLIFTGNRVLQYIEQGITAEFGPSPGEAALMAAGATEEQAALYVGATELVFAGLSAGQAGYMVLRRTGELVDIITPQRAALKVDPPVDDGFHPSGFRIEFYDESGRPLKWRNPLTDQVEVIPADMVLHRDHILPIVGIKRLPGFDELTGAQQKLLLQDPRNFQPLEGRMNCSKHCRIQGTGNSWDFYRGKPIDPNYSLWLKQQQDIIRDDFLDLIDGWKNVHNN